MRSVNQGMVRLKITHITHERIRIIMCSHVSTQCGLVVEALWTVLAVVGSNLAVLNHVLLERFTRLLHFGAQGALKRGLKKFAKNRGFHHIHIWSIGSSS